MTDHPRRLTRQDITEHIGTFWGRYLPAMDSITDAEQQQYAQAQGFAHFADVLVHINTRWGEALQRIARIAQGDQLPSDPASAQSYAGQDIEQIKQDFEMLRSGLGGRVAELPDAAFDDPQVQRWLHTHVIALYDQLEPPGDPQIPSATYGGATY